MRASSTKPPTSRSWTFSSTVASRRPFSDEIMAGPRAAEMRATWPSGTCDAAGAGDEHRAEGLRIRAIRVRIAHAHRKALPPFDGRGQRRFADGVRDHVLDVTDADAIACGGRPVDLDVQVLAAGHLLGIDVAGARDLPDDVRDLPRQPLERPEIVAEQLHADLGADAGRQHVDAVDDRHRPDGRDSRELDGPAHLGAQRVQRQARAPLRRAASAARSSRSC